MLLEQLPDDLAGDRADEWKGSVSSKGPLPSAGLAQLSLWFSTGFFMVNYGFQVMPVSLAEALRSGEPIFVAITARIMLGTKLGWVRSIALALIVSGLSCV